MLAISNLLLCSLGELLFSSFGHFHIPRKLSRVSLVRKKSSSWVINEFFQFSSVPSLCNEILISLGTRTCSNFMKVRKPVRTWQIYILTYPRALPMHINKSIVKRWLVKRRSMKSYLFYYQNLFIFQLIVYSRINHYNSMLMTKWKLKVELDNSLRRLVHCKNFGNSSVRYERIYWPW